MCSLASQIAEINETTVFNNAVYLIQKNIYDCVLGGRSSFSLGGGVWGYFDERSTTRSLYSPLVLH